VDRSPLASAVAVPRETGLVDDDSSKVRSTVSPSENPLPVRVTELPGAQVVQLAVSAPPAVVVVVVPEVAEVVVVVVEVEVTVIDTVAVTPLVSPVAVIV
jgi:hypothetical protein